MLTVRHLEREWTSGSYRKLMAELLAARGEASPKLMQELSKPSAVAAMVMVRLDELGQSHAPLFSKLLRTVLATQETDGGWGDPAITALALRALSLTNGQGPAADRGLAYLAALQKDNGLWPAEPIRRLAGDAYVTAWILFHLGNNPSFRRLVQYDDALAAMELMESEHSTETKRLWARVNRRQLSHRRPVGQEQLVWS